MEPALIVVGCVALLGLVWFIATYNRLVSVRQHIRESWADIDVELKRRYDLIPNLVAAVKGYAAHESSVLEQVVRLRNTAAANHGAAAEQAVDETALAIGLKQLFAVVENYPQLKANEQFNRLMDELSGTENRIAVERMRYNEAVQTYNTSRRQFPANVTARLFSFKEYPFFEAPEAARDVPKVNFSRP